MRAHSASSSQGCDGWKLRKKQVSREGASFAKKSLFSFEDRFPPKQASSGASAGLWPAAFGLVPEGLNAVSVVAM